MHPDFFIKLFVVFIAIAAVPFGLMALMNLQKLAASMNPNNPHAAELQTEVADQGLRKHVGAFWLVFCFAALMLMALIAVIVESVARMK